MKRIFTLAILTAMLLGVAYSWGMNLNSASPISLAIYQQNLAAVSEVRELEINSGIQEKRIEDIPHQIIPTSLQIETLEGSSELTILEQSYHYQPITKDSLLESYLGEEIEVIGQGSMGYKTYKGTLLSSSGGIILKDASGKIALIKDPVKFSFPGVPEGLTDKPYLLWKLANKSEKVTEYKIRMNYLTQGLNWNARYLIVLSEDSKSDLTSWVSVSNHSGKTFQDASLDLVTGELHQAGENRGAVFLKSATAPEAGFEPQKLFEYHQYSLDRITTLRDKEEKQLSFITAKGIEVEKLYTYQGQSSKGVQVSLNLINSTANGLGKPLPAGIVRLYKEGKDDLKFIGEDRISHTPKDETVKLILGTVFDVVGERKRTDYQKVDEKTYLESYQIALRNHKEEEVTVKVIETLRGSWDIVHSYPTFEKLDAQTIAFTVTMKPGGEAKVRYTVKYSL